MSDKIMEALNELDILKSQEPLRRQVRAELTRLRSQIETATPRPSDAAVAWRFRWYEPHDALWEIVPHKNMLPTNRNGWIIEPLFATPPDGAMREALEEIAEAEILTCEQITFDTARRYEIDYCRPKDTREVAIRALASLQSGERG